MSTNMKITRICEFCKNEFTARTTKTRYCSLSCNSRGYKLLVRQSKITESNKQTEITKNPSLEVIGFLFIAFGIEQEIHHQYSVSYNSKGTMAFHNGGMTCFYGLALLVSCFASIYGKRKST
ncbi:hypothetical protein [Flavobacterium sp. ZT3R18]|uniref:hypothetical protein n=1 Tax=Flavobacterium sp. ZT3R18 TaxID=2594429 RepID=UPI00163D8B94|nr:hypothetical protein [Flavobacterium sp. ZT3R18]